MLCICLLSIQICLYRRSVIITGRRNSHYKPLNPTRCEDLLLKLFFKQKK